MVFFNYLNYLITRLKKDSKIIANIQESFKKQNRDFSRCL